VIKKGERERLYIVQIEIGNEFLCMTKFSCCDPSCFVFRTLISRPADQIEEFAMMMAVKLGI